MTDKNKDLTIMNDEIHFDFIFDRIKATQVTPEFVAIKFYSEKAKKLWKEWKRYSSYDNRLECVDVILPSDVLAEGRSHNKLLDFVMHAREKGLLTNRMSE